jgi:hypothetical protein
VLLGALFVMPGFVPGIHVFRLARNKTWTGGTSPGLTGVVGKA